MNMQQNLKIKEIILSNDILCAGKIGNSELNFIRCAQSGIMNQNVIDLIHINAGVYPTDMNSLEKFFNIYVDSIKSLNLCAEWIGSPGNYMETPYYDILCPHSHRVELTSLEPFYFEDPWSESIEAKRVLVISPFERSLHEQMIHREHIWKNKKILPKFELATIRTPLSAGINQTEYETWFDALDNFKEKIYQINPDFCIVGAGAWSLPLVSHCNSLDIDSIHLGGGTQILFGIMGNRWKNNTTVLQNKNEYWTRPSGEEIPTNGENMKIDNGDYW